LLNQFKGHAGAWGAIALGVYQIQSGDFQHGILSICGGLVGLGIIQPSANDAAAP